MTPEQVFSAANGVAVLSWVALVALPRLRWIATTVTGLIVPALLAVAYVALIVVNWEARDARERHVPHWLLAPCLILTFLFGPAGWLLYQLFRGSAPNPGSVARGAIDHRFEERVGATVGRESFGRLA